VSGILLLGADTTEVLIRCRKRAKSLSDELELNVPSFDYVSQRNESLGNIFNKGKNT